MNTTIRNTLGAAALSLLALGAFAQTATPRVDNRQAKQEARIEQGKASGELNKAEAARVDAQQNRIDKVEEKAKADGTVTKGEKATVTHMQNKADRKIRRQKHDRQEAAPAKQ